jgi:hypothetical protein
VTLHYSSDAWQPTVDRLDTTTHEGAPDTAYRLRLRSLRTPAKSAEFRFTVN